MRVLLIGPAFGRGARPDSVPLVGGRVGKLLKTLTGLADLTEVFEPRNLLNYYPGRKGNGDDFHFHEAKKVADNLDLKGRVVVLLGRNVARCFGLSKARWFEWHELRGGLVTVAPHPSGRNRWWNDPANREQAQAFWRELVLKFKSVGSKARDAASTRES